MNNRVAVKFDGKEYDLLEGVPLSVGLFEVGCFVLGTSRQLGRPRGLRDLCRPSEVYVAIAGCDGVYDPNKLLVREGLDIRSTENQPRRAESGQSAMDVQFLVVGDCSSKAPPR